MKITAIVLAAGSGKRMKSTIPKQFLSLKGKPVLYYSLKAFEESAIDDVILVTTEEKISYCKEKFVDFYGIKKIKKIIAGGEERYDSVFAGLQVADNPDYVLIHDGARPILSKHIIKESIQAVKKHDACVVGVPVKDTIKEINAANEIVNTPERKYLWQIQTPQSFRFSLISTAYEKVMALSMKGITDDAMVLEKAYEKKAYVIKGDYKNIKITTPEDMKIAELFLEQ